MAILNYTFSLNGLTMPQDKPYLVNIFDKEKMEKDIKKAKASADIVIVLPHWGTEYIYNADDLQKEYTDFFARQGVDIVIGSHPHVIQPMEWVVKPDGEKMLVYYSLGNFLSRQDRTPRLLGAMARITVEKEGSNIKIVNAGATPIVTHYEYNGSWKFSVLKLKDYTEEQASVHNVLTVDSTFSRKALEELAIEVLGGNIK